MTGRASAELICKAKVMKKGDLGFGMYEGYCGEVTRPNLFWNELGEIDFDFPEGWHITFQNKNDEDNELHGETIVRCPKHCEYVEYKEFRKGEWIDVP